MTRRETETMAERRVVEETQKLLGKMAVSMNRGASLEGEHVAVLADPEYNERDKTLQVLVTCFAFGHQNVAWEKYNIRGQRDKETVLPAVYGPLTARGQALLESLSPGTYSLALVDHQKMSADLVATALDPRTPEEGRRGAVKTLQTLASKPGKHAAPVLIACLGLLCESSLSAAIRASVAQSFSSDSAIPLRDVDLGTFANKLLQMDDVATPESLEAGLEQGLAHAFGSILSARSLDRPDDKELLRALIARTAQFETVRPTRGAVITRSGDSDTQARRATVVRTRGAVRVRGRASRLVEPAVENPLIVLARTGGARVRNALVALLRPKRGNDDLISALEKVGD